MRRTLADLVIQGLITLALLWVGYLLWSWHWWATTVLGVALGAQVFLTCVTFSQWRWERQLPERVRQDLQRHPPMGDG